MSVNIRMCCKVRSPMVRNSVAAVMTPRPLITPSATSNLARMTPRPRLNETRATTTKPVVTTALASWSANPHLSQAAYREGLLTNTLGVVALLIAVAIHTLDVATSVFGVKLRSDRHTT